MITLKSYVQLIFVTCYYCVTASISNSQNEGYGGTCKHIQRRVIHCHGIATEAQYFSELSNQQLGESLYKGHEELAIFQHPFKGTLSNYIFNFTTAGHSFEFLRLSRLILRNGEIRSLAPNVFSSFCSHLSKLDLSLNKIQEVPLNAFVRCGSSQNNVHLKILNLSGNLIENVHNLRGLSKLSVIDLSNNSIFQLGQGVFTLGGPYGLNYLTQINLSRNYLQTISADSFLFSNSKSTSRNSEKTIALYIQDNPLHCDCSLRWLVRVYSSIGFLSLSGDDPICITPDRLKGFSFTALRPLDLVCEPIIIKSSRMLLPQANQESGQPTIIHVYEGDRLELNCVVFADPKPRTWWTFKDSVTIGKTLVDQVNRGRYFINTTSLHKSFLNISTTLLIDQVQITDSGQIRCVAGFYPGTFLHSERNETSELFQIEVHARHYRVKPSGIWTFAVIIAVVLFFIMCIAVAFWFKWIMNNKSTSTASNKKIPSSWTLNSNGIDHVVPLQQSDDVGFVNASRTHVLDLGPPMYHQHNDSTYSTNSQYNSDFRVLTVDPSSRQLLANGSPHLDDFDISAYDEDYRLLSDDLVRKPNDAFNSRHQDFTTTSPLLIHHQNASRYPSSTKSITAASILTKNPSLGETEL
ncbi:hypothetical protein GJ496_008493 [Pomphorhynchus laevis]|nr:hypothetical protein GJ496_008493 [Pomphorhynchus laevis]